jgi:beta-lactamase superfamily II metal-dependent hydrolase
MPTFHYLNVKQGDCSIIQHTSGHVTVIDVFNAKKPTPDELAMREILHVLLRSKESRQERVNQKEYPVNPIEYLQSFGINSVFRFILTHPDMDHMGGIKDFFEVFNPLNFWDTGNDAEKEFEEGSPYDESDWEFYRSLRDENPQESPKRLTLYSGNQGKFWNIGDTGELGGDGIYILAPTPELVKEANETEDYNDCSYVLLYRAPGGKIVLGGDSHDKTWTHILLKHRNSVTNVDLLIAPHHGRKSKRSYEFLDVLNPKVTFFGNASAEDLAYSAWRSRGLKYITNNQANCMVVDTGVSPNDLYVTNEAYAHQSNPFTFYSDRFKAYYWGQIT